MLWNVSRVEPFRGPTSLKRKAEDYARLGREKLKFAFEKALEVGFSQKLWHRILTITISTTAPRTLQFTANPFNQSVGFRAWMS